MSTDPLPPRTPRAPFVAAGLIAAAPLLALMAAAPGGAHWSWLKLPAHTTLIAAALGIAASFARTRGVVVLVMLGTVAGSFLWEYLELRGLGGPDLSRNDMRLLFSSTVEVLAPWLAGAIFSALAWIAIPPSVAHLDRMRAALWLAAVGAIAVILTVNNSSWLTLKSLGNHGTFKSSTAWPDTKVLSLVVAALVTVGGTAVATVQRRARRTALPRATLRP